MYEVSYRKIDMGGLILIEGPPIQKARPRASCKHGKPVVYTDPKEKRLAESLRKLLTETGVTKDKYNTLSLIVVMEKTSRRKTQPDVDNLLKFYADLLNGVAYEDDRQITQMDAELITVEANGKNKNGNHKSFVIIRLSYAERILPETFPANKEGRFEWYIRNRCGC